ncbi:MAG: helix-turn-helix domain-containing protein [Candidatus Heimdallarchaeota archaeon]
MTEESKSQRIIEVLRETKKELSTTEIAEKTGINRSIVYTILETLAEQGIVAKSRKIGKSWLYCLPEPENEN